MADPRRATVDLAVLDTIQADDWTAGNLGARRGRVRRLVQDTLDDRPAQQEGQER